MACYICCSRRWTVSRDFVKYVVLELTSPLPRLICGVIYWYLWTILVPRLGGYHLEEEAEILSDGTTITKLVRVKNE